MSDRLAVTPEDGSPAVADARPPGWANVEVRQVEDPHDHEVRMPPVDALQLILVTAGSYVIESARPHGRWEKGQAAPGRSAATPPGREIHAAWRSRSPEQFTSLHVTIGQPLLRALRESFPDVAPARLDFLAVSDDFVRASMLEIARAARVRAPALLADTVSVALVSHLLSLPAPIDRRQSAALSRGQLAVVTEHLSSHLAEPMTLDELAALVHLSPFHFLRRFSSATGSSPMRYLTALRMERGRDLLRRGDVAVSAVAAACGYSSPAAFSAAYRRHHGFSPREHRTLGE